MVVKALAAVHAASENCMLRCKPRSENEMLSALVADQRQNCRKRGFRERSRRIAILPGVSTPQGEQAWAHAMASCDLTDRTGPLASLGTICLFMARQAPADTGDQLDPAKRVR